MSINLVLLLINLIATPLLILSIFKASKFMGWPVGMLVSLGINAMMVSYFAGQLLK